MSDWDGKERRNGEEWGYFKATVEQNTKAVEDLTDMFKSHVEYEMKHHKEQEERNKAQDEKIQKLHDDVNVYKTVIKVMKALGWTAAFLLAFKFGDIADLWRDE